MKNNFRKGFTLIEILIVVAIIAILATVVLVGLGPTQLAGRDARRLSDLREVQQGLQLYFNKCGVYPNTSVAGSASGCGTINGNTWAQMSTALTGANIGVTSLPNDPLSGRTYYYTGETGADYVIGATLESSAGSADFNGYTAPTLTTAFGDTGAPTSCTAPVYCLTL